MDYHIYRQRTNGTFQLVASTRFKSDADAIYDRWHAAYIICNNDIVKQKNISGGKI